jgi:hypothetical protein
MSGMAWFDLLQTVASVITTLIGIATLVTVFQAYNEVVSRRQPYKLGVSLKALGSWKSKVDASNWYSLRTSIKSPRISLPKLIKNGFGLRVNLPLNHHETSWVNFLETFDLNGNAGYEEYVEMEQESGLVRGMVAMRWNGNEFAALCSVLGFQSPPATNDEHKHPMTLPMIWSGPLGWIYLSASADGCIAQFRPRGRIRNQLPEDLHQAYATFTRPMEALETRFWHSLGALPIDGKEPRAIYLGGADGSPALDRLKSLLEDGLGDNGGLQGILGLLDPKKSKSSRQDGGEATLKKLQEEVDAMKKDGNNAKNNSSEEFSDEIEADIRKLEAEVGIDTTAFGGLSGILGDSDPEDRDVARLARIAATRRVLGRQGHGVLPPDDILEIVKKMALQRAMSESKDPSKLFFNSGGYPKPTAHSNTNGSNNRATENDEKLAQDLQRREYFGFGDGEEIGDDSSLKAAIALSLRDLDDDSPIADSSTSSTPKCEAGPSNSSARTSNSFGGPSTAKSSKSKGKEPERRSSDEKWSENGSDSRPSRETSSSRIEKKPKKTGLIEVLKECSGLLSVTIQSDWVHSRGLDINSVKDYYREYVPPAEVPSDSYRFGDLAIMEKDLEVFKAAFLKLVPDGYYFTPRPTLASDVHEIWGYLEDHEHQLEKMFAADSKASEYGGNSTASNDESIPTGERRNVFLSRDTGRTQSDLLLALDLCKTLHLHDDTTRRGHFTIEDLSIIAKASANLRKILTDSRTPKAPESSGSDFTWALLVNTNLASGIISGLTRVELGDLMAPGPIAEYRNGKFECRKLLDEEQHTIPLMQEGCEYSGPQILAAVLDVFLTYFWVKKQWISNVSQYDSSIPYTIYMC